MQSLTAADRDRIDGIAAFAAATFVASVFVIAALERVGAPDALVEALGPLFAAFALGLIGLANRAASLTDFLAARRATPGFYAGLSFASALGGVGLMFATGAGKDNSALVCLAAGASLAGLVVAPAIRAAHASSGIDVLATRYPQIVLRIAFGLLWLACGVLVASAGFHVAARSLSGALGGQDRLAVGLAYAALAFTLVPGGAKSALWADAASASGVLLILLFGAGFAALSSPTPAQPLFETLRGLEGGAKSLLVAPAAPLALALAFGVFAPFLAPGMTTPTVGESRWAGLTGLFFAALGFALLAVALPFESAAPASARHTVEALIATIAWLPGLTLARAGALAASRSFGIDLARAYSRLTVLSSRRIAVSRLVMLGTIALCPVVMLRLGLTPERTALIALAVGLGGIAPSLIVALMLPSRAGAASGLAALVVAAGVVGARIKYEWLGAPAGDPLLVTALAAAIAALVAGLLVALVLPARKRQTTPLRSDPFLHLPFDPVEPG